MCRRHTRNMSTITGRLWKEHVYWMRFSTGLQEIQDDISSKWEQMGSNHHSLYLISQRPDFPLPTQRTDLTWFMYLWIVLGDTPKHSTISSLVILPLFFMSFWVLLRRRKDKGQTALTPTRIYPRWLFDDFPAPLLFGFRSIDDAFILKQCDDSRNGPSRYSHPVTDVR